MKNFDCHATIDYGALGQSGEVRAPAGAGWEPVSAVIVPPQNKFQVSGLMILWKRPAGALSPLARAGWRDWWKDFFRPHAAWYLSGLLSLLLLLVIVSKHS